MAESTDLGLAMENPMENPAASGAAAAEASGQDKRMARYNKAYNSLVEKGRGSVTVNAVMVFLEKLLDKEYSPKEKAWEDACAAGDTTTPAVIRPDLDDIILTSKQPIKNRMSVTMEEFVALIKGIKFEKREIKRALATFTHMDNNDSDGLGNGVVSVEDVRQHLAEMAGVSADDVCWRHLDAFGRRW